MNQRIEWIDVAKGIGIFLVIVGHLISHDNFNLLADYIYSFHMPLFFFLSGLCLNNNRTFVSYVGRKAK
jgi:fucose 4-O-acetylase-like acetyltransferase